MLPGLNNVPFQSGTVKEARSIWQRLARFFDASSASNGDALLAVKKTATGATATTQHELNERTLEAFDFMTAAQIADVKARTRLQDVSVPMQAFFDACAYGAGHMPAGDYLCNTPLIWRERMKITGDGVEATTLVTTADINQIVNDPAGTYWCTMRDINIESALPVSDVAGPSTTATITSGSPDITVASATGMEKGIKIAGTGIPANTYIRRISGTTVSLGNSAGASVNATANGVGVAITTTYRQGPTKFQVYLKNAGGWLIDRVHFNTTLADNDYSPASHAGLWLDRDTLGPYFINTISHCLFHHSQCLIGTSDSDAVNCDFWGNPFDYSLWLAAPGCQVVGGSISAGVQCGLKIAASATEVFGASNHGISGTNIDGGDTWYTGYGVIADQPVALKLDAKVNGCYKGGIRITDSSGGMITGRFFNNNRDGAGYSDVEIVSDAFQTTGLSVWGSFIQTAAVTPTPGYAIKEINEGFWPAFCSYAGTVSANYATGGVFTGTLKNSEQHANTAGLSGSGLPPAVARSDQDLGNGGLVRAVSGSVAGSGTLNLTIDTGLSASANDGYAGIVTVSAQRANASTQSRRTVYAVSCCGTTLDSTVLETKDGSGGGSTFTLTASANGVLTYTNTSADTVNVRMSFIGSASALA